MEGGTDVVRLKDIALACGVSASTVSRALNGLTGPDKKNSAMIRQKAKEMGYFPNAAARTLKTSRSHNIGILYADGKLVGQDISAATEWLRKAADNGSAAGARNLGLIYYLGYGVEQDYAQALTWFRKAADAGDAAAMHGIGDMYRNGQGVAEDSAKADEWYQKARDAGFAD